MSRPLNKDIIQGKQSWDADVRDNQRTLFKTPLPLPNGTYKLASGSTEGSPYSSSGALPPANAHDGCLAAVNESGTWRLYESNGTNWRRLVSAASGVTPELADNSGGTSGGDTIAAVSTVADAANAIATLAAKLNSIIVRLGLDA